MKDNDVDKLHLKLDRMARAQIARGLRESQMTDSQQIAYAYVWHEYEGDVDLDIFRKVVPQLDEIPFNEQEKNEALEWWAEADVDPVRHCIRKCFAPLEVDVEVVFGRQHVGDPCDIWFRIHGGNWHTLDKLEEETRYYQHRAEQRDDNHPSLSAEQRNPSMT